MKNFVLGNFPFLENDFDAMTDYELFCKMIAYVKKVAITNKTFVDNLNDKLDAMYQNGQLENLITQYLELQNTYTYDSVSDMKAATNLVANSFTRTSGYNSYNDGGGAFYKVREKTVDDTTDEKTLIELEDDLVAELVIINTLDIRQLGIFPSEDNTDDLNSIADILTTLKPTTLIINGNYVIGDTVLWEDLSDMKIQFKGLITAKSYANTEKPIFTFDGCTNITINDYNVTSTLDKTEPAPSGHVRESYLGSCRIGIKLQDCENIYLNNCKFNNMYWDLFPHGTSSSARTKNVYLKNTISRNASIPVYGSYLDGFYVDNYDCIPKEELGAGNHIFYISHYSDNLYFNNVNITTDGYDGFCFAFNNAQSTPYNNVQLNNINITGTGAIYCATESVNFKVNNLYYNYVDSLVGTNEIIQMSTGEMYINDSVFNNNKYRLIRMNTNCNCYMDNIIHNMENENSNYQTFTFGSTGNNLLVSNSKIKCEILFYNGYQNNIDFKDCNFYTTTSEYFQSTRNADSKVHYLNCFFTFSNNQNFSYQGGSVTYENTVYILNCFLNGFNNISSVANDDGFVIVNSYKNYTLIE